MRFFREMNLPNRLTMARVMLLPFFILFMCLSVRGGSIDTLRAEADRGFVLLRWLSVIVFSVASLTDYFDGKIARKHGLITDFGKFMDPIADKLLVCSALILFSTEGSVPVWATLIVIAREFIISGIRLVASEKGTVIAASYWGKAKTSVQMIMSIYLILPTVSFLFPVLIKWVLILASTVLTLVSLVDYISKNKKVFLEGSK